MSHLGDRLSALVDGELDGAERDKATAHLARCEECRAEAAALRDLKRQLRALAAETPEVAAAEADLVRRLMAMTIRARESGEPPQRRLRVLPRTARSRPALPSALRPLRPQPQPGSQAQPGRQAPGGPRRPQATRRRRRYLALGAMSIVVSLGTAAFTAGGGDPAPGPKITPQMELYSQEHAITTGEVPFAGTPGSIEGGPGMVGTSNSAVLPAQKP